MFPPPTMTAAPPYATVMEALLAPTATPMTTYTQAPPPSLMQQTFVAPPASYVAPPAMMQQTPVATYYEVGVPMPPPNLTAGIPDPNRIEQQKQDYAKALDKQLQDGISTVQQEIDIEKKMALFKIQKDIALFEAQIDEKLVEQLGAEDERAAIATTELNKRRVDMNIQLDNQAANVISDYNRKFVTDDIAKKKKDFERQYWTAENKLARDFGQAFLTAHGVPGYSAPAPAVPGVTPAHPGVKPAVQPAVTPAHHPSAPHPHGKPTHGAV